MKRFSCCVAVIIALSGALTGCSKNMAIPKDFCSVPVNGSTLSPLLPDGEQVKKTREDPLEAGLRNTYCYLGVDGVRVLSVTVRQIDKPLPPEDWKNATSYYRMAAERRMTFPGRAVIGADGALVVAKCGSPTAYILFDVDFYGGRVENTQAGYKKLQRFLEDFTPAVTKKLRCTT